VICAIINDVTTGAVRVEDVPMVTPRRVIQRVVKAWPFMRTPLETGVAGSS
tara:strand:+ start:209 stop:361 length:153 start_codon:yes stop_codon:yes gene_type:complete